MDSAIRFITVRELPELSKINNSVATKVWPKFMLNDPIAAEFWHYLYEKWPDYQFAVLESDRIVAIGNSVPLYWKGTPDQLPEEGWDWILPKAVHDSHTGQIPNLQAAIQIMVPPEHQGKGKSALAIKCMKQIGLNHGHANLIVPARPNLKHQHPYTPMEEYLTWRDPGGLPFDPWIRVHVRLGAQIVKVCHRSMQITGTLEEWNQWTGLLFTAGGTYIVPGALAPVTVDMEKSRVEYIEPNVWLWHSLLS